MIKALSLVPYPDKFQVTYQRGNKKEVSNTDDDFHSIYMATNRFLSTNMFSKGFILGSFILKKCFICHNIRLQKSDG